MTFCLLMEAGVRAPRPMIEAFSAGLAAGGELDHLAPAAFEAFVSSPAVTSRQDGKAAAAATQNDARAAGQRRPGS